MGLEQQIESVVASLGAVRSLQAAQLMECHQEYTQRCLSQLVARRVLVRRRFRSSYTYSLASSQGWQPPAEQIEHTLLVVDIIIALRRCLDVTSWAGEPELHEWVSPGDPRPDGLVCWQRGTATGRLLIEADRGTESLAVWERKLAGYTSLDPDQTVLAALPSEQRARRVAQAAHETGVPLLAAVSSELLDARSPHVFDAVSHRRVPLTAAVGRSRDPVGRGEPGAVPS